MSIRQEGFKGLSAAPGNMDLEQEGPVAPYLKGNQSLPHMIQNDPDRQTITVYKYQNDKTCKQCLDINHCKVVKLE